MQPDPNFWRLPYPILDEDLEWMTVLPPSNPISKDHPCYGAAFCDSSPKVVAGDFMGDWVRAESCRLVLHLDEGVWWDYTQGYPQRPLNRRDPIDDAVLAERCWGRRLRLTRRPALQ